MVGFGDVLRFDPGQISSIFAICSAQQATCSTLGTTVRSLDSLSSWQGDAADAARAAAGRVRVDIDSYGVENAKVAAAARDCFNEATALVRDARSVQAQADGRGFIIDPVTGAVTDPLWPSMAGWSFAERQAHQDAIAEITRRVAEICSRAERFDDGVAALLNAASGGIALTAVGETPDFNPAARQANQIAAFRSLYGRPPISENDWRVAEVLDPHSYSPKNHGVPPQISVVRINPVPGQGVVATGLFIPTATVHGGTDDHLGDNRGFDPAFDPEDTRVTYVVDYETGLVIARQNPSATADGTTVRTGTPRVRASQLDDGTVLVNYDAADPLAPPGTAEAGWSVNGQTIITPGEGDGGGARISGYVTDYPSMETYQYLPDGQTRVLHTDGAGDHTSFGPFLNLPLHHEFGDYDRDFEQFPGETRVLGQVGKAPTGVAADTTPLGPVGDPPVVPGVR
ncbi:hypothetical protein [Gordonia sp. NPDC003950]